MGNRGKILSGRRSDLNAGLTVVAGSALRVETPSSYLVYLVTNSCLY
jgi:hypothetical protein